MIFVSSTVMRTVPLSKAKAFSPAASFSCPRAFIPSRVMTSPDRLVTLI